MAGRARCRKACIDVVFVARGALRAGMGAGQREQCCAVIERCSRPGNRVVACRTLLREARRCVVRVCRAAVLG